MMCNCSELRDFLVVIDSGFLDLTIKDGKLQGVHFFSDYFQEMTAEEFDPEVTYQNNYYTCKQCSQYWYIETTPDEYPSPMFGIKIFDNAIKLSLDDIKSKKEFLNILAHDGFGNQSCRFKAVHKFQAKREGIMP